MRADISYHQGEYQKVVIGINNILDPFETTVHYLQTQAAGLAASAKQMLLASENVTKASQEVASGSQLLEPALLSNPPPPRKSRRVWGNCNGRSKKWRVARN